MLLAHCCQSNLLAQPRVRANLYCAPRVARYKATVRGISGRDEVQPANEDEATECPIPVPPTREALVETLLSRAASRVKRGPCTCITCKGAGVQVCDCCQGRGLLTPGHASSRTNVISNAVQHVTSLFGDHSNGQQGLVTNRCRRCHGVGKLPCSECHGSGARFPKKAAAEGVAATAQ